MPRMFSSRASLLCQLFASRFCFATQLHSERARGAINPISLGELGNTTSLPILWLHIHKEFGTWVCHQAIANRERVVSPADNCNYKRHDTFASYFGQGVSPAAVSEYRVLLFKAGKFTFGEVERPLFAEDIRPNDFRHAIMLRHPLKSMDSNLNFEVARDDFPDAYFGLQVLKKQLGLDPASTDDSWLDILLTMIENKDQGNLENTPYWNSWKSLDNFKVRNLVGEAWLVPPGGVNQTHFDMAIERLNKFFAVGVSDENDQIDVNAELFKKVNWNVTAAEVINPTIARDLKLTIGRENRLMKINALDAQLYEHAKILAASTTSPISFLNYKRGRPHSITLRE